MDVHVQLTGDNLCYFIQQSDAVDTAHLDGGREVKLFVHVPFHVEDTVTITGFQLVGNRTVALVDLYAVLTVDESQRVITGNGMTTGGEDKLRNIVLCDIDRLLAVEVLRHDEIVLTLNKLCGSLGLFFSDEGNIAAPSFSFIGILLTVQLVDILLAQDDVLLTDGHEQVLRFPDVMELT